MVKKQVIKKRVLKDSAQIPVNPASSLGDIFSKMTQSERDTAEKILVNLLDKKNIEMKTEIQMPLNLTRLEILAHWSDMEHAPRNALILKTFANMYRINMVSHDRQSRMEIIQALAERLKSEERSLSERLAEPPA